MSNRRGSLGGTITNWRGYDAPFATKLRLLVRNNWTKLRKRQGCCGNDGEPGC